MFENISDFLDNLAKVRQMVEQHQEETKALIDAMIPDSIRAQIAILEHERSFHLKTLTDAAEQLEQQIKAAVIVEEKTESGAHLMAVYSPPKAQWDGKALDGYAVANPAILAFKTMSKPSVTIRKKGGAK